MGLEQDVSKLSIADLVSLLASTEQVGQSPKHADKANLRVMLVRIQEQAEYELLHRYQG